MLRDVAVNESRVARFERRRELGMAGPMALRLRNRSRQHELMTEALLGFLSSARRLAAFSSFIPLQGPPDV
jgi:hypothetical protein